MLMLSKVACISRLVLILLSHKADKGSDPHKSNKLETTRSRHFDNDSNNNNDNNNNNC